MPRAPTAPPVPGRHALVPGPPVPGTPSPGAGPEHCELYSPGALFSWPELQAMAAVMGHVSRADVAGNRAWLLLPVVLRTRAENLARQARPCVCVGFDR